ncbi:MAG: nitroreductase family protein [Roseburia sp.]|nr:nitroreductase family protein [Roseburia sp.]MCM1098562.1 nitroreductase family protein [Ruminococcus flavefaciens]
MSNVIEAIKTRSSTRGYTAESLTESELDTLLHAGLQAPTAANRQEIHFTVLKGGDPVLQELEEEKNRLRNITEAPHNFYYEAPVVVILSADADFKWGTLDAGIAVENMALAAEELGLGSLIIGCILDAINGEKKEHFAEALKLPPCHEYKIAVAFGHKAVTKEPHTYDAEKQVTYL